MLKNVSRIFALILVSAFASAAEQAAPLHLTKTISLPGVNRKWDHFGVDLKGHRLFATSEEDPVIELFDLRTDKHIRTLTGFAEPHNVVAIPELGKLLVVDGGASEVTILDSHSYKVIGHTKLSIDADPYVYDPITKYAYIVNGGRASHTPFCLISIVDVTIGKKLADVKLDTNRLESMAIEKTGNRLFVNMTGINRIGVLDRKRRAVVATWTIKAGDQNVPMQLDEASHRLFVVTRKPSKLVVLDTQTGEEIQSLDVAEYVDDLAYDSANHRLYLSGGGGAGAITVVDQRSADNYEVIATIPTKPGAKTARFVPELHKYYVGVPAKEKQEAQILVFDVQH
ncbi:MAG: Pyrrolo-quinoline quinone beta-propeller repeat-containing protein [Acidobacteriaceae bacterium]|jgi:DNA-binding beta-propeller fold protein YncE|nr:Pyrrolo-quinoline quinone beta-propeller repeat-containing protein [Acidobacteriaceae bacterium]